MDGKFQGKKFVLNVKGQEEKLVNNLKRKEILWVKQKIIFQL